ncbi:hypothetical protein SAMN05518847_11061 [Paenibacillus sp. OV219]|nr:hypothetical protein SAMN05518847_11061 [Paenibacillus sp. OV219]
MSLLGFFAVCGAAELTNRSELIEAKMVLSKM